jgi:uncharacterized protein
MGSAGQTVFRQFVLKVHSRCNLACDYCYMYEHADQTWRSRPVVMADETMAWTARRIGEHCRDHHLAAVRVVFHGGEPLLAGATRLARLTGHLRAAVPPGCDLDLSIQTNGILLDEELCELFLAERIRVGISLDGGVTANDRHRRYLGGRSSHTAVLEAVRLINQPRYRTLFSGLLCTIDPMNDPLEVYDALATLDPPAIDFLLPHATWDAPPNRTSPDATPYADWLLTIFERWRTERSPVRVRMFDAIGRLATGGGSLVESLGLDDTDLLVIETDGAIEQVDTLKVAYEGAPATGLDIRNHSLDEAAEHAGVAARIGGADALCETCQSCPVVKLCGGGHYAHRYRTGSGFANPSVYCPDLYRLVEHVSDRPPLGGSPLVTHVLAEKDFDDLARGGGDVRAIEALAASQRSLRRARLAACVLEVPAAESHGAALHAAWEALCELDERAPAAVEHVLGHPYLGLWSRSAADDPASATYLWGTVMAASMLAGMTWHAKVPVGAAGLMLPTLGLVRPPETPVDGRLAVVETEPAARTIHIDDREVRLVPAPGSDGDWLPLRPITLGGIDAVLDDVDPYRACFHRRPADRLDDPRFTGWRGALATADEVIARDLPRHLPAIRAITTLTPLDAAPLHASATHRQAYGAVGVAATRDPADLPEALVLALVHEVQHAKLGAVLDLFPLLDGDDTRRYHVGWREDARPIEGVLQGAYAHLAVVEVWRRRQETWSGAAAAHAATTFAALRDQTRAAIDTLLSSGSLTPLGRRWVEHMRADACGTSS